MTGTDAAKLLSLPFVRRGDVPERADYPVVKYCIVEREETFAGGPITHVDLCAYTWLDDVHLYIKRARLEELDDALSIASLKNVLFRRLNLRVEYQKNRAAIQTKPIAESLERRSQ